MVKEKYLELRTKCLYTKNLTLEKAVKILGDYSAGKAAFTYIKHYQAKRRANSLVAKARNKTEKQNKVRHLIEKGWSKQQIAEELNISVRYVNKLLETPQKTSEVAAKKAKAEHYFNLAKSMFGFPEMEEERKKLFYAAAAIRRSLGIKNDSPKVEPIVFGDFPEKEEDLERSFERL